VTARWWRPGTLLDDDLVSLRSVLVQTGMTAGAVLRRAGPHLEVTLLVKASGREAAGLVAVRVVEVAYRVAGLGALSAALEHQAERYRQFRADRGVLTVPDDFEEEA